MLNHGILNRFFLLNSLLFKREKGLARLFIVFVCLLVLIPNSKAPLDALLTVRIIVFVIGLERLNHVTDYVLRGLIQKARQNVYPRTHTCNRNA